MGNISQEIMKLMRILQRGLGHAVRQGNDPACRLRNDWLLRNTVANKPTLYQGLE